MHSSRLSQPKNISTEDREKILLEFKSIESDLFNLIADCDPDNNQLNWNAYNLSYIIPILKAVTAYRDARLELHKENFSDPDGKLMSKLKGLEKNAKSASRRNAEYRDIGSHFDAISARENFNNLFFEAAVKGRIQVVKSFSESDILWQSTKDGLELIRAKQSNDQTNYKKSVISLCEQYNPTSLKQLRTLLEHKIIDVNMNVGTDTHPKSLLECAFTPALKVLLDRPELSPPKHTIKPFKIYLECGDKTLAMLEHADPDATEDKEDESLLLYMAKLTSYRKNVKEVSFLFEKSKRVYKKPQAEYFLLDYITKKDPNPISWEEANFLARVEKERIDRMGDVEIKDAKEPKDNVFNELAKKAITHKYKQALVYIINNRQSDFYKPYYLDFNGLGLCDPNGKRSDLKETIVSTPSPTRDFLDNTAAPLIPSMMKPHHKSTQKNSAPSWRWFGCCRKPKKEESTTEFDKDPKPSAESKRSTPRLG